jgi:hypothetical protein
VAKRFSVRPFEVRSLDKRIEREIGIIENQLKYKHPNVRVWVEKIDQ